MAAPTVLRFGCSVRQPSSPRGWFWFERGCSVIGLLRVGVLSIVSVISPGAAGMRPRNNCPIRLRGVTQNVPDAPHTGLQCHGIASFAGSGPCAGCKNWMSCWGELHQARNNCNTYASQLIMQVPARAAHCRTASHPGSAAWMPSARRHFMPRLRAICNLPACIIQACQTPLQTCHDVRDWVGLLSTDDAAIHQLLRRDSTDHQSDGATQTCANGCCLRVWQPVWQKKQTHRRHCGRGRRFSAPRGTSPASTPCPRQKVTLQT